MQELAFADLRGRKCVLSKPHGAAGSVYHLMVNNFYCGQIVNANGKWTAYPNTDTLPKAYWDKLVKWIEENEQ